MTRRCLKENMKKSKIYFKIINKNIIKFIFDSKKDLTNCFIRITEFYESPKYKGKYFTKEEFLKWYTKQYKSSYYKDWNGFNFTSEIVSKFIRKFRYNLTEEEGTLINFIMSSKAKYIIGVYKRGGSDNHELAHALFYTNKKYKREMLKLLNSMKGFKTIFSHYLMKMGYHTDVLEDEKQAYLVGGLDEVLPSIKLFEPFISGAQIIFKKYF